MQHHPRTASHRGHRNGPTRVVRWAVVAVAAVTAVVGIRSTTSRPGGRDREDMPFDPELHLTPPFAPFVGLGRPGDAAPRRSAQRTQQAQGLKPATDDGR